MAEELTQEQKDALAAAEALKLKEEQEKLTIPKSRFDEVNNRAKLAEEALAKRDAEDVERAKKDLEEKGKFKELYEKEQAEKARLENEVLKRDLIQEAITNKKLHPRLTKMVTGSTKEEIDKSIVDALAYQEEVNKGIKDGNAAPDNSGNGKPTPKSAMSQEEWMRLYEKDPKEADRVLKEMTDAANKK